MNLSKGCQIETPALALKVEHLSADHAVRAGRAAHLGDDGDERFRGSALLAQHDLEGERQQSVACEHRDSIAKNLVVRGLAASIVVVVHRGQIVVNQGIRMNHLNGASRRQEGRAILADGISRRHQEHGAQTFAARHEAVFHRLFQRLIIRGHFLQLAQKSLFHQVGTLFPFHLKIHVHPPQSPSETPRPPRPFP